MSQLTESAVTIMMAIVGVAILSVLVSKKSNTTSVISSLSAFFANSLSAATAPVTGASASINTGGGQWGFSGLSIPTTGF